MELVIVERRSLTPMKLAELQAKEDSHGWCLEANGVRFLRTYASRDGLRMICMYEAPDAEAVRRVSDLAGMPYEAIWSATVHQPGDADDRA